MGLGITVRIGDATYLVPWYFVGALVLALAGVIRLLLSRGQR